MAGDLDLDALRELVWDRERFLAESFTALRQLSAAASAPAGDPNDTRLIRSMVIRCLEYRSELNGEAAVLDALVRKLGLFPYVPENAPLSSADALALEAHRSPAPGGEVVFHAMQAAIYWRLLDGQNVILSAPTSFGKSLIIDALLLSGRYRNLLVVVPTLALIDETRRRFARYGTDYKLITHGSQGLSEKNVFVLTQERLIEREDLPNLDFFAIDEFYKLAGNEERAELLNRVFYRLRKSGAQYYLLGPNIEGLDEALPEALRQEFLLTEDTTVALEVERVSAGEDQDAALLDLCNRLDEPTLIFASSPAKAHAVAATLLDGGLQRSDGSLASAVDWSAENYHPDWLVGRALAAGIGIHHGQLPRSLGQFMVRAFEEGRISFLICTSTLIEGVNTQAKNVVVLDDKISNRRIDFFTFNNILGRGGRMFRHFTGRVFLFHDQPSEELFRVDIPILSQGEDAPTGLLLHVDPDDLHGSSQDRLAPLLEQQLLPREVLEANTGIPPEQQIKLAERLADEPSSYHQLLGWRGNPDFEELAGTCEVLVEHLQTRQLRSGYVRSARQLAFRLRRLAVAQSARALIEAESESSEPEKVDELVQGVSEFLRRIAGYQFPMRLRALERIQEVVFSRVGLRPGSYAAYALRVENLFLPNPLIALDEYGIPPELARKLRHDLQAEGDLDLVLERLAEIDPGRGDLTEFEVELLTEAQSSL